MKQCINIEQLLELEKDEMYILSEEMAYVPLRDIETSDMFEEFKEYNYRDICSNINTANMTEWLQDKGIKVIIDNCIPASVRDCKNNKEYHEIELCDALWKAVKDDI